METEAIEAWEDWEDEAGDDRSETGFAGDADEEGPIDTAADAGLWDEDPFTE